MLIYFLFLAVVTSTVVADDPSCASSVAPIEYADKLTYYKVITEKISQCATKHVYKFVFKGEVEGDPVWRVTVPTCGGLSGTVELRDGLSETGDVIFRMSSCADQDTVLSKLSTSRSLTLIVTVSSAGSANVVLVVQPVLPPSWFTAPVPFRPNDLQVDLAFAIDATIVDRSTEEIQTFDKIKAFAAEVGNELDIHNNGTRNDGARVALHWLSHDSLGSIGAPYWSQTGALFVLSVKSYYPYTTDALYNSSLTNLISNAFVLNNSYPPRQDAERVLLVITHKDASDTGDLKDLLLDNDVHPIIVNFGTKDWITGSRLEVMLGGSTEVTVADYGEFSDPVEAAKDFVENFLGSGSRVCPLTKCDNTEVYRIISSQHYHDLNLGEKSDGKVGRYCNYHDEINRIFRRDDEADKNFVSMVVKYELEPECDFLSITDSKGVEQALFSGYDVVGSRVCFEETKEVVVRFKTDNKLVYGGFHLNATFVNAC